MMDTIFRHRSIRKYKSTPIKAKVLDYILKAGVRASTTGNMQVYSIIVTKEKAMREKLWELHFKQNMVMQAPLILTFCADFNRFNKWCKLRKSQPGYDNFLSFYTASIDALLAAQNVALAAEESGLGICYLGTTTYNADKIVSLLNLPKDVVPVTTLVIGYPDEEPDLTDRLPMDAIIHKETYQDFTPERINKIYKNRETSMETKKLLEINNKETLAQIFTDNRYTKKDNILFSNKFLKIIKDQGFMNNE
ncbi:MAG TPA: NADPH-dependent oxidoreductase [Bacteroidales bacterium]|nr:NADPH-dependent oxidoreductase [Bacteroidales bacterium]